MKIKNRSIFTYFILLNVYCISTIAQSEQMTESHTSLNSTQNATNIEDNKKINIPRKKIIRKTNTKPSTQTKTAKTDNKTQPKETNINKATVNTTNKVDTSNNITSIIPSASTENSAVNATSITTVSPIPKIETPVIDNKNLSTAVIKDTTDLTSKAPQVSIADKPSSNTTTIPSTQSTVTSNVPTDTAKSDNKTVLKEVNTKEQPTSNTTLTKKLDNRPKQINKNSKLKKNSIVSKNTKTMADIPLNESSKNQRPSNRRVKKKIATDLILTKDKNKSEIPKKLSMADIPLNESEYKKQEQEISETITPDLSHPPELNSRLIEQKDRRLQKNIYLAKYMEPWRDVKSDEPIQINFENQEITELLKFLENNLDITFILDDNVGPKRAEGLKPITGNKITFRSNTPLNLKQVWDLGLTFLEMSGYSVIPTTTERTYRVTASQGKGSANSEPLPTFISTDDSLLPDSDLKIRYIYFVENADLDVITKIIDSLRSNSSAGVIKFPELRALILTDKASNIRSLLNILQEVDKVDTPETLAIIRLRHADASDVVKLYTELVGAEEQRTPFGFNQRKNPSTHYFTKSTRVFDDPRTNSLIILGTKENIKKFEDFVTSYIDRKSQLPYAPMHIYSLKYLDSTTIADILNKSIQEFNSDPSRAKAAQVGGVRDGSKFFKPSVKITAEPSGNRLIINADYEDYLKLKELLDELDIEQPQVALKVLILNVDLTNAKEFGSQIRNDIACCDKTGGTTSILGPNINYQFAGLNGVITRNTDNGTAVSGAERLLGNLIELANFSSTSSSGLFGTGSTLVTLGQDLYGFWGLLRILESIARVTVVANPFLVTTNKYAAEVTVGETRRVLSAVVQGGSASQPAFGNLDANLSVKIEPQISYDDMITLNIYVELSQFTTSGELPTRSTRQISSSAIAANKEVIALGGLVRDTVQDQEYKVPILGDIPLFGWLFKAKTQTITQNSLLILICPEIIRPTDYQIAQEYTEYQLNDTKETLYSMEHYAERRDPIHRWFFKDHLNREISEIDKFTSRKSRYVSDTEKEIEREQSVKEPKVKQLLAMNNENSTNSKNKSLIDIIKEDSQELKDNKANGVLT
ncbi:secretin N-terminal domain-containing protein [Candidatus Babela massiliensis]|uniref:Type II secretory pathway component PulD n=1 Tax=Candidatus Babela massiliensis TaxID=673862 RepID=V6DGH9_9BACT|nr:secretin N-terminal domain-containing protein [Candidatus Babela massiliensis]CDK30707.1 Type II secretory pathway component PulD [Candidatus Babela massiliensis]